MLVEIIIFLLTFVIVYFVYTHWRLLKYFDEHGIKYLPSVPVFGNFLKSTLAKRHFIDDLDDIYKAFPNERYVGLVEGTGPVILIRDPDLIKQITVKDFDHFMNHKAFSTEETDPLFGASLFQMKDNRWRDMRITMSPAFTGSKMRLMMPYMTATSKNIMEYLSDHLSEDIAVDDVIRRYTNDVIASAAFGIEVNSLKDQDNQFYKTGQTLIQFTVWQQISMFFIGYFPNFAKFVGLKMFPEQANQFFRKILTSTIEYRVKNNVERPDMIQLLMDASKGTLLTSGLSDNEKDNVGFATVDEELKPTTPVKKDWTQNELVGQLFLFFFAGFESSANALIMCIHEMALSPHVQDKLYQEVRDYKENHGELTFDNMNLLKYLDCVLNETLRKWSPAIFMDRTCTKTYELPASHKNAKPYIVKPGDVVINVVNCIQMDPKYYPDPHTFDPERFSDENKQNILPFTFMPFGMGPRNCIASRFALLEVKILLYNLVLNFKILKTPKTMDPIRLYSKGFNIRAADGTWVKLEQRSG